MKRTWGITFLYIFVVCLPSAFVLVEPKIVNRSPSSGNAAAAAAKRFRNDFPTDTFAKPSETKNEQVFQDEVRRPVVRNSDVNQLPSFHETEAHFAPETLKEKLEASKVTKTQGTTTRREPFTFQDDKDLEKLIDSAYNKLLAVARLQTNDKITVLTNFQLKDFVKQVLNPENVPLSDAETAALDAAANQYIRRQGMSPGANNNQIQVPRNFVKSWTTLGWFKDRAPELTKVREEDFERRMREEAERLIRLQEQEFNDNNNVGSNDLAPGSDFSNTEYSNTVVDSTFNPLTGLASSNEVTIDNSGETIMNNADMTPPSSETNENSNDSPVMTEAEQLLVEQAMRMLRERDSAVDVTESSTTETNNENSMASTDATDSVSSLPSDEVVTDEFTSSVSETPSSTPPENSDVVPLSHEEIDPALPVPVRDDNQYDNVVEDSLGI